ncbi:UDP-4-amino-4,6-dideoxy-N-acetyl-beta-L-altrosamine transaminase [Helicobacter sp. 16-1353]|uniref:UDP-4-amino-4, 6-dideoxy-N-acetyl-beta-L-altrosamine transaminase n=1 Tax=Helicobacter sp. 16-1353 TaxID=2004996 RepID=UPI000DCE8FDA|nr:UDP-4-amino-4,6-dideoxy-N-acetyl-beta-L-altrosamine transaminase [Helicobacter sp. 16-1353]RAX53044.1 UDP-4-amino-4,6-dideoxy-N-acetyl-beta-L-altrosamine transaminase [Helicobacter sp. 16-1353]
MIPYSTQCIDDDDINAVIATLKSDFITQGEMVDKFEKELAKYLGVKFVAVFNSATSALNIAYKILPLSGSRAITTPLSFCATTNMMLENNINPIFCDCDDNGNISPESIKANITNDTKAIVSVDFAGNSVDVDRILDICKEYNLYFISDSSHSCGGEYKNKKIGQFADMTIFSFHALKPITTIEGGAIATNNEIFYNQAILLRSHSIIKKRLWNSELDSIGYNFRLSDVASSLGLSQLKKLDFFINKRHKIALFYDTFFKDNRHFRTLNIPSYIKSTHHLYPILLNQHLWCYKEEIFNSLLHLGIGVQVHYKPIYQYNLYKKNHSIIENVENFYKSEISIPCHQKMNEEDAEYVADSIIKILQRYN